MGLLAYWHDRLKDGARMANSVDPDQSAPSGAFWSGSTLFAKVCLSKNHYDVQI